jgi:hypothetical protein
MHQSCVVEDENGDPILLVVGGKVGATPIQSKFTNSVIGFNMKEVFAGKPATKTWASLESMHSARANFSLTVVNNQVFVYGGIQCNGSGTSSHLPQLSSTICEMYDA